MSIPSADIDVQRVQAMLDHLGEAENLIKLVRTYLDLESGTVNKKLAAPALYSMADNIEIAKSMLSGFHHDSCI